MTTEDEQYDDDDYRDADANADSTEQQFDEGNNSKIDDENYDGGDVQPTTEENNIFKGLCSICVFF